MNKVKNGNPINHWTELPFQNCREEEIDEIRAYRDRMKDLDRNCPHLSIKDSFTKLPFRSCNNYEIMLNCMSSKQSFLKLLENNNLNNQIITQTSLLQENFNCGYKNENSFQKVIKSHNSNPLKIIHLNIRSLNKHKLILKTYLESLNCDFDLIFLSETGNANVSEIEEIFDNYTFYIDNPIQKRGSKGGSGILINKNSFNSIEEIFTNDNLKGKCSCSNCIIETKWLKLSSVNQSYTIGSIYRHPNGNVKHFTESLDSLLGKIDKKSTCIMAGDINIDIIKQNQNSNLYIETLIAHNILPYICTYPNTPDRQFSHYY